MIQRQLIAFPKLSLSSTFFPLVVPAWILTKSGILMDPSACHQSSRATSLSPGPGSCVQLIHTRAPQGPCLCLSLWPWVLNFWLRKETMISLILP